MILKFEITIRSPYDLSLTAPALARLVQNVCPLGVQARAREISRNEQEFLEPVHDAEGVFAVS